MTRTFAGIVMLTALSCASSAPSASGDPARPSLGELPPTPEIAEALLTRVAAIYQGHAAASTPAGTGTLTWKGLWDDTSVDARAEFHPGPAWAIAVTGGLLTSAEMTTDAFAAIICHETGHLVGGFPFKGRPIESIATMGTVSAAEAQSDYFATQDCLPRLWADDTAANAAAFAALDAAQRARCTAAFGDLASQQICARSLLAAVQMGRWLVSRNPGNAYPQLDTPDTSAVQITRYDGYPSLQCRVDTLVAGAQCSVKHTGTVIPGLMAPYGEFSYPSEAAARPFACQSGPGARPRCWFQPDGVWTDCSALGRSACVVADGQDAVRLCSANFGVEIGPCSEGTVCKSDESGAYCDFP